jgi:hypothetical protein
MLEKIVRTAVTECWGIGSLSVSPILGTASPKIKNLPTTLNVCWDNIMADVYRPETWYFGD